MFSGCGNYELLDYIILNLHMQKSTEHRFKNMINTLCFAVKDYRNSQKVFKQYIYLKCYIILF